MRWRKAWDNPDRPPHETLNGWRFYALVGPAGGWSRDCPAETRAPMSQRWEWRVKRHARSKGRRVEAEGVARSRAAAKACAEAVLRVLDGAPQPLAGTPGG